MKENETEILPWCGIYRVVNLNNNKRYIGQTTRTFHKRWKEEIREALYCRKNWGSMNKLATEICTIADEPSNKYIRKSNTEAQFGYLHFKGIQEWHNEVTKEELLRYESNTIKYWDSYHNGYNGKP